MALIARCLSYPFFRKTSIRCFVYFSRCSLSYILRALVANVLRTPSLWVGWWCEEACKYCSVWVFFLYTWRDIEPSSFLVMRISMKGRLLLTSTSIVNFMEGDKLFRCCLKVSRVSLPWGHMMNVSSTYIFYNLGFRGAILRDLFSNSSINKLEIIGERGNPMATPHVCS